MHSLRLTSNVKTILSLPFARKERFRGPVWPTAPGLGESAPPALPGRAALTLPPSRHTYGGVLAEPSYNNKKPGRGQFFRGNDQGKRTSFLAMRRFSSPANGRIRRLQRPCPPRPSGASSHSLAGLLFLPVQPRAFALLRFSWNGRLFQPGLRWGRTILFLKCTP